MSTIIEHIPTDGSHHILPAAGIFAAFGSYFVPIFSGLSLFVGSMAGLAACAYYVTQTLSNPDVRVWLAQRRERKRQRAIAKLQYKQSILIGELKRLGVLTHAEVLTKETHQTTSIELHDVKSSPEQ